MSTGKATPNIVEKPFKSYPSSGQESLLLAQNFYSCTQEVKLGMENKTYPVLHFHTSTDRRVWIWY